MKLRNVFSQAGIGLVGVLLLAGSVPVVAQDDLDTAFRNLKDAEAKKNPDLVMKLAPEAAAAAKRVSAAPAPQSDAEKANWKARVEFAKQVETYAEYSLYAMAAQVQDPKKQIAMVEELEKLNPKSQYFPQACPVYFLALEKTGQREKIMPAAERAVAVDPDNEDVLLMLADGFYSRRQLDKALLYANRLTSTLKTKGKPEGLSEADWERKKAVSLGRGYWIAGMVYSERTRYYDADANLRAALPYIKGSDAMRGPALFYLGVANYQLGKSTLNRVQVQQALNFSQEAAQIKGPFQNNAYRNAVAIQDELRRWR